LKIYEVNPEQQAAAAELKVEQDVGGHEELDSSQLVAVREVTSHSIAVVLRTSGQLRSHHEEKPFRCRWPGCGKGFARHHNCEYHEQLHRA
jgi:hypothetical protein